MLVSLEFLYLSIYMIYIYIYVILDIWGLMYITIIDNLIFSDVICN